MVSIYTLIDPETKLVRYVGKTSVKPTSRYAQHIYQWKRSSRLTHLNAWIKNLADKGLKPIMEVIDEVSLDEWITAEKRYIKLFKSAGCNLVNLTLGGEGSLGYKHTKESKDKRLESLLQSEAWKQKHVRHSKIMKQLHAEQNINFGTAHLSDDIRKELGKKHSIKLKEMHANNPDYRISLIKSRSIAVDYIDQDDNILMSFRSAAEAGRFFNINNTHITRVCKGKSDMTHGKRFRYGKKKD
jgi:group I intron endonuclease